MLASYMTHGNIHQVFVTGKNLILVVTYSLNCYPTEGWHRVWLIENTKNSFLMKRDVCRMTFRIVNINIVKALSRVFASLGCHSQRHSLPPEVSPNNVHHHNISVIWS